MNLILTGLRGTGKTSIGRRLAHVLRRSFHDTDERIERQIGEPIATYVGRFGWEAFREVEHQVICRMARLVDVVISTGGGTLTYERNIAVLKPTGVIILLAAEPLTLAQRLKRSYARPPLTTEDSVEAEVCALWAEREPVYRRICDVVLSVDAETGNEEADIDMKVMALLDRLRPLLDADTLRRCREFWPQRPGSSNR